MRRLRFTLPAIAAAAIGLAGPAASQAAACGGTHVNPSAQPAQARKATLCLLNVQRRRHGLSRLHAHRSLGHAATSYARLMVRKRFFDHVSPSGSTMTQRIRRTAYLRGSGRWTLGENLAWGSGSAASPAQIVRAWMHSAGHRRNILDGQFREIGIGIANGAPNGAAGATYATEFGARR